MPGVTVGVGSSAGSGTTVVGSSDGDSTASVGNSDGTGLGTSDAVDGNVSGSVTPGVGISLSVEASRKACST